MFMITEEQREVLINVVSELLDINQEEIALKLHGITSRLTYAPDPIKPQPIPRERAWWNSQ